MVTAMHDEWTDRLSEYIDDELSGGDRAALEAHLAECGGCTELLDELRRVASRARSLTPRPPQRDLWPGIDARIERVRPPRRLSFTLPQLAAASLLIALVSGALAWKLHPQNRVESTPIVAADHRAPEVARPAENADDVDPPAPPLEPVSLADAQYDAAVADLQRALAKGRGHLDKATVGIVEDNLRIIDQAIDQAQRALTADPANAYLSGHLVETRRKKLDLLRRAAALAAETN